MIGLSNSLSPDGSPGHYNDVIAGMMKDDFARLVGPNLNPVKETIPVLGMQWEIWDALEKDDLQSKIPLTCVASPPTFLEADILDPKTKTLRRLLAALDSTAATLPEIVEVLNRILDDGNFAASFRHLEIPALQRVGHRSVWREERRVPAKFPLRTLQRRRVNRLIVERLCPGAIRPGQYLGAGGVFRMLFNEMFSKSDDPPSEIWLYAHPEHMPACKRDAKRVAGEMKILLPRMIDRTSADWPGELWDPETAQSWCRNADAWQRYQGDMNLFYDGDQP